MTTADERLSKRERQVMDVIYRLGEASAADVLREVDFQSNDSAIRTFLRNLERKQLLKHRLDGARYIYSPRMSTKRLSRSLLQRMVDTFFGGSPAAAVAALLEVKGEGLSEEEADKLRKILRDATEGKR
jgi:predicted transcriptional regulator